MGCRYIYKADCAEIIRAASAIVEIQFRGVTIGFLELEGKPDMCIVVNIGFGLCGASDQSGCGLLLLLISSTCTIDRKSVV